MAKQGMKHPEIPHTEKKKSVPEVPQIMGKARHGNEHVNPIISGTKAPSLKVFHSTPHTENKSENPISNAYKEIDTDLARDNLENDIPYADLQDLQR